MISNYYKFLLVFISSFCFMQATAQTTRDNIINKTILPVLNSERYKDMSEYNHIKSVLRDLENKYGYEVFLKQRLLEPAFYNNDIDFFKTELTILVRDYGFDVAYMKGYENYYEAIIGGALSGWFKEMYLKNHVIWLSNNFDKQVELRKLNALNDKDQNVTAFAMSVLNIPGLDNVQQDAVKELLGEYHFKNFEMVIDIAKKREIFPDNKNFAILQTGFDTVLIHNFQFEKNQQEVWDALFPYIKKAYLNNEITNVIFQNYDFYYYQHFNSLVFGSYTFVQMPEQFRKSEKGPIPIKDPVWLEKIKKEFKWED